MTKKINALCFRLARDAALRCALIALLLALQPCAVRAQPAGPTVVRTEPVECVAGLNQTVTVTLFVADAVDLYGADIRLAFDPAILQVVDADPAAPAVQIAPRADLLKPDFVVKRKACNTPNPADPDCPAGGLVWYAATQVNPSAPATGSGALTAITFRRLAPGDAELRISYQELVTRAGALIPAQVVDGRILMPSARYRLWLPTVAQ